MSVGNWNGIDSVQSLAVMGGGWSESIKKSDSVLEPSDANSGDVDIGFRCIQSD